MGLLHLDGDGYDYTVPSEVVVEVEHDKAPS
jgi:hypothetical protein